MTELDDPARLSALERSGLLLLTEDDRLQTLTYVATKMLHARVSILNVVSSTDAHHIASYPKLLVKSTIAEDTACRLVVLGDVPLAINDLRRHPTLCNIPYVTSGEGRGYLGVPVMYDGQPVGVFCVVDDRPREWTQIDMDSLRGLAVRAGLSVK